MHNPCIIYDAFSSRGIISPFSPSNTNTGNTPLKTPPKNSFFEEHTEEQPRTTLKPGETTMTVCHLDNSISFFPLSKLSVHICLYTPIFFICAYCLRANEHHPSLTPVSSNASARFFLVIKAYVCCRLDSILIKF